MFFHEKLICYQKARTLIFEIAKELSKIPRGGNYLKDQLTRSLSSVLLNLSEGNNRRSSLERKRFFDIAKASCAESAACLDLLIAFNLISKTRSFEFKSSLLEITKILCKLK